MLPLSEEDYDKTYGWEAVNERFNELDGLRLIDWGTELVQINVKDKVRDKYKFKEMLVLISRSVGLKLNYVSDSAYITGYQRLMLSSFVLRIYI
jgi:hypothetical protein